MLTFVSKVDDVNVCTDLGWAEPSSSMGVVIKIEH